MRFKLVESFDIIEAVSQEHNENMKVVEEVRQLLTDARFTEEQKLNGIAFIKESSTEEYDLKAQMYIDTSNFSYSCYITTEDDDTNINFSSKGNSDGILAIANKLITEINSY